jgi:hypothetical protein
MRFKIHSKRSFRFGEISGEYQKGQESGFPEKSLRRSFYIQNMTETIMRDVI